MVVDTVKSVGIDLVRLMYGNIVIAGGTTLCKGVLFVYFLFTSSFHHTTTGFSERLRHELNAHVPRSVEINIVEDPNRHLATWIGKLKSLCFDLPCLHFHARSQAGLCWPRPICSA